MWRQWEGEILGDDDDWNAQYTAAASVFLETDTNDPGDHMHRNTHSLCIATNASSFLLAFSRSQLPVLL